MTGRDAARLGVARRGRCHGSTLDTDDYVIGAKNFSEQYILAELMADRIEARGRDRSARASGLGSVIAFRALANGELDAYVDYSGTIWANVMQRTDSPLASGDARDDEEWLLREARHHAARFARVRECLCARDAARHGSTASGFARSSDLAPHARQLRIGGDFEFFARPEWRALRDRYGLHFREQRQYQSTFMYKAVASGEVDVISAFSSDGRIAAYDLVVLEDPEQVILPYDAILLVSAKRAKDPVLRRALAPLVQRFRSSACARRTSWWIATRTRSLPSRRPPGCCSIHRRIRQASATAAVASPHFSQGGLARVQVQVRPSPLPRPAGTHCFAPSLSRPWPLMSSPRLLLTQLIVTAISFAPKRRDPNS